MDVRKFYDKYFMNLNVKEPEIEKQLTRIERLRREINFLQSPEKGLFVGIGRGAEMVSGKGKLVALDLPFRQLSINQNQHPENLYVCGDGRLLPFRYSVFDYVVCSEVIEHIKESSYVIRELGRVLKQTGILILSTPNWWSFYGLFRKAYELVFKRKFHADDQPIDEWTTPPSLIREMRPWFIVHKVRGSWYWPPTGKGEFQLFPRFFAKLFYLLRPVDFFLGNFLPYFGHSIWIIAQPRKGEGAIISKSAVSPLQSPFIICLFYLWTVLFTGYAFYRGEIFKIIWYYIQRVIT